LENAAICNYIAEQSRLHSTFVDKAMTLAAVGRLVHHSTIFELNVESYRRRAASPGNVAAKQRTKEQRD